jgi:hypothetical protein
MLPHYFNYTRLDRIVEGLARNPYSKKLLGFARRGLEKKF